MKFVGLTGGIGTGKSTVRAGLAARGAEVMDVDQLTRELQEPGQPFYEQIVARWGAQVIAADGRLDREALGKIVFGDREQLGEITGMAAPLTANEIVRRASEHLGTDTVVVVESALFLMGAYGMTGLVVVDAPVEVALQRLVSQRGMTEADARARVESQLPREVRLEHAGFVIDNSGDTRELEPKIDAAWAWMQEVPDSTPTVQPR